jgi:hypothetical protein
MKINFLAPLAAIASFALASSAFASDVAHNFMPENDLWREDMLEAVPNVTEEMFNQVIQAGRDIYAPAAALRSEKLTINALWADSTVNAGARRMRGEVTINMYGGLARREEITVEGFALVLCHELSHAYGGEPYIRPLSQIAAEGQADYMGAKECLAKVLPMIPQSNDDMLITDNGSTQKICDSRFPTNSDEHTFCLRKFSAGFRLGKLLSVISDKSIPQYNTPDTTEVTETKLSYPATVQCRIDTYAAGFSDWTQPACWFKGGSKNNPVPSLP